MSATACTPFHEIDDVDITLTLENFQRIWNVTGAGNGTDTRYLYRIENLAQDDNYVDPPCTAGASSRWVRVDNCSDTVLVGEETKDVFFHLINQQATADSNPYVRDILMPQTNINGLGCDDADLTKVDFIVQVGNDCWQNTHPDNYQVYDMTYWTTNHNGNDALYPGFAPIYWPAEGEPAAGHNNGTFVLKYPDSHRSVMQRWHNNKANFGNVGRYGDTVSIRDMPAELQRQEIADEFCDGGYWCGIRDTEAQGPTIVCGSPNEVANDRSVNIGTVVRGGFDMCTVYNKTLFQSSAFDQLETSWLEIALYAPDQLRQKVAWALSQLIVISPDVLPSENLSECFFRTPRRARSRLGSCLLPNITLTIDNSFTSCRREIPPLL